MTVLTAVLVVLPDYLFQRAAAVADGDPGIGGASAAPCFNLRTENLLRGVVRRSEIFHGRATRRLADVEVGAPFGGALTEVDRAPTVVVSPAPGAEEAPRPLSPEARSRRPNGPCRGRYGLRC